MWNIYDDNDDSEKQRKHSGPKSSFQPLSWLSRAYKLMLVQIVDKTASLSKCQKFALVANVMNRTHKHGLKNNVINDFMIMSRKFRNDVVKKKISLIQ